MNFNIVGVIFKTLQEGSRGGAKKGDGKGLIKAIVGDQKCNSDLFHAIAFFLQKGEGQPGRIVVKEAQSKEAERPTRFAGVAGLPK